MQQRSEEEDEKGAAVTLTGDMQAQRVSVAIDDVDQPLTIGVIHIGLGMQLYYAFVQNTDTSLGFTWHQIR